METRGGISRQLAHAAFLPDGGAWELYDLDTDRTETRDLAAQHPELVRELAAAWESWAARAQVEDWAAIGGEKW